MTYGYEMYTVGNMVNNYVIPKKETKTKNYVISLYGELS